LPPRNLCLALAILLIRLFGYQVHVPKSISIFVNYTNDMSSAMEKKVTGDTDAGQAEHHDAARRRSSIWNTSNAENLGAVFENPLSSKTKEELLADVDEFVNKYGLMDFREDFHKGALVAQSSDEVENMPDLSSEDKDILRREKIHRWSQPWMLYWLCIMCSLAAGMFLYIVFK
jgi:hypothetical protein